KPRPRWGVPGLGFGVMAIVGHQSQIREAEHSRLRSHRCGLSVTSKRKGADRSGHKKEAPRRSPPGLLSMNWCTSAYAVWGNQTHHVRGGAPEGGVNLGGRTDFSTAETQLSVRLMRGLRSVHFTFHRPPPPIDPPPDI